MTAPVALIFAGFDPGSVRAAVAVIDATAAGPPVYVDAKTWTVGHLEPLAKPVPWTRKLADGTVEIQRDADGSPRMRTHRHVLTPEEAEAEARKIVAWMKDRGVTTVLIEDVERLAPGETIAQTVAMGTENIQSGKLGQSVFILARAAGIDATTTSALRARSIAVGRAVKGRGEAAERALCEHVTGWATRERTGTGEERRADHERDAGVLALAGVRLLRGEAPATEPKRTRAATQPGTRAPRKPRTLTPESKAAQAQEQAKSYRERRAARLEAAGLAGATGRVHVCAKCGGPRRGHLRGLPCPDRS